MKSVKLSIFGLLGCLVAPAMAAQIGFAPSVSLEEKTSTNFTRLPKATFGSAIVFQPQLEFEIEATPTLFLIPRLYGSLTHYLRKKNQLLGDAMLGGSELKVVFFPSEVLELGVSGNFTYSDSKTAFLTTENVTEAIDTTYTETSVRPSVAYFLSDDITLEAAATYQLRHFQTLSSDLVGNQFKEDFYEYGGELGPSVFLGDWKLSTNYRIAQREYFDQMAEFSDGRPAFTGETFPLLRTLDQNLSTSAETSFLGLDYQPGIQVGFVKDQIFGARDALTLGANQKIAISEAFEKVSIQNSASVLNTRYQRFRSTPLNAKADTPKRIDWEGSVGLQFSRPWGDILSSELGYEFARKVSNYTEEKYTDHVIRLNLLAQF